VTVRGWAARPLPQTPVGRQPAGANAMTHALETDNAPAFSPGEVEPAQGFELYSVEELLARRHRCGMRVPSEAAQLLEAPPGPIDGAHSPHTTKETPWTCVSCVASGRGAFLQLGNTCLKAECQMKSATGISGPRKRKQTEFFDPAPRLETVPARSSDEVEAAEGSELYSVAELLACANRCGADVPGEATQLLEAQPDPVETWDLRVAIERVREGGSAGGREAELAGFHQHLERFA
jgi:hypothetical protein